MLLSWCPLLPHVSMRGDARSSRCPGSLFTKKQSAWTQSQPTSTLPTLTMTHVKIRSWNIFLADASPFGRASLLRTHFFPVFSISSNTFCEAFLFHSFLFFLIFVFFHQFFVSRCVSWHPEASIVRKWWCVRLFSWITYVKTYVLFRCLK